MYTPSKLGVQRHQKMERWGTNNDKTNVTHETTNEQTKKNCNRGTVLDRSEKKKKKTW